MGKPYELIFVDDGSQDESGTFLKSVCEKHPNVNVITLRRNFGPNHQVNDDDDDHDGPDHVAQYLIDLSRHVL